MISYSADIEETDHLFLGAAGEREAEEQLFHLGAGGTDIADRTRENAERLARFPRRIGERFCVVDDHLDARTGNRVDLLQDADDVRAGLHERLGRRRRDVGLNEYRPVGREAGEQRPRLGAERMELFRRDVQPDAGPARQHADAHERDSDGDGAHHMVQPQGVAPGGGRPMPAAQQQDVQVKEERGDRDEVEDGGQADDALREVVEVEEHAERRDRPLESGRHRAGGAARGHEDCAEQPRGDERDRRVARQHRREHPDRDQGRPGEPVAGVVADHQSQVGAPEIEEDHDVAERQRERDGIDAERRGVLAQHHFHIGDRKGEQQLVGPQLLFFRPDPHREGRDKEEEEVGEDAVELIQVGEVLQKEAVLPEGGGRAQENEERDEDVAARAREVQAEIAPRHGPHDRPVHLGEHLQTSASPGRPSASLGGPSASAAVSPAVRR